MPSIYETTDAHSAYLIRLRTLRSRASALRNNLKQDFRGFLAPDGVTFASGPAGSKNPVSAATTCTGLMALASTGSLAQFYEGNDNGKDSALRAFKLVMAADWNSSGLRDDNPFTTIIVIRTAGILAFAKVDESIEFLKLQREAGKRWKGKTLEEIGSIILAGAESKLAIQHYPATSAAAYWLLDGVVNLRIPIPDRHLQKIAHWTHDKFVRELSLISANHDALMDPIGLAMSAALTWKLTGPNKPAGADKIRAVLPSAIEVGHGVRMFLEKQLPSGLWPKYFPLFHFPGLEAGANYCWFFEVLEALLLELVGEFELRDDETLLSALEKGLTWCEHNRLLYEAAGADAVRSGWNAGGNIRTLQDGKPELWATAVVHMYAHRTEAFASRLIQRALERKYDAQRILTKEDAWEGILDYDLELTAEEEKSTVKREILTRIIEPVQNAKAPLAKSALLFGPPGTSKTGIVKAVAQRIGWAYIELGPTDFLRDGLSNIYSKANEILDDLKDLKKVVILFDEMDALTRTREDDGGDHPLDVTQQFLTTSMLPKLAHLHDQQGIIFFMATNFQSRFDAAIKRPGRFDLLLLLGPPSWERKVAGINQFWRSADGRKVTDAELAALRQLLLEWAPLGEGLATKLDDFTFGEMRAFFESAMTDAGETENHFLRGVQKLGQPRFAAKVLRWYDDYITLRPRPAISAKGVDDELTRYQGDKKVSRRQ